MFIRALFLFFPFAVTAVPVFADGNDQNSGLNFDGSFRLMTRDDSTSTSKCIGNPISPVCAFETYMACQLRGNEELCEISLGKKAGPPAPFKTAEFITAITGYRIMAIRQYTPEHLPYSSQNRFGITPWDVGIKLEKTSCYGGECQEPYPHDEESYLLRKKGNVWFVVYSEGYQRDFTDLCHVGYYDCKFGQ